MMGLICDESEPPAGGRAASEGASSCASLPGGLGDGRRQRHHQAMRATSPRRSWRPRRAAGAQGVGQHRPQPWGAGACCGCWARRSCAGPDFGPSSGVEPQPKHRLKIEYSRLAPSTQAIHRLAPAPCDRPSNNAQATALSTRTALLVMTHSTQTLPMHVTLVHDAWPCVCHVACPAF
jgi:hypothetical protein